MKGLRIVEEALEHASEDEGANEDDEDGADEPDTDVGNLHVIIHDIILNAETQMNRTL